MTPEEALAFLKANVTLPKGATMTVKKDTIVIGNADANFVLRGDLLLSEESSILAVQRSLPFLLSAMQDVSAQKEAAKKAVADISTRLATAKLRRKNIHSKLKGS